LVKHYSDARGFYFCHIILDPARQSGSAWPPQNHLRDAVGVARHDICIDVRIVLAGIAHKCELQMRIGGKNRLDPFGLVVTMGARDELAL
jgi:hypothetical protein